MNKADRNELPMQWIRNKAKEERKKKWSENTGKQIEMERYKSFVIHFMRITHFI